MVLLRVLLALLLLLSTSPPAFAEDGTIVAPSSTQVITGPNGVCKKVTNTNATSPLFVPNLTTAEWLSFYSNPGTATVAICTCSLPWGGTLNDGSSVTAYSSATPAGACTSFSETRTCMGATLSGSYTNQSCTNGCTGTPWGSVATGYSNTAYSSATPSGVTCASVSQTRVCIAGTLSGTYTVTSCSSGCAGQSVTWNTNCSGTVGALSSGGTQAVTNTAIGYTGSVTETCTNGVLSQSGATCAAACGGSYTIAASTTNANLFTIAGSPSCTGGAYTFTINSGVIVGSTSTGTAALVTGTFPAGSTVTLINNGTIRGMGGAGGAGATLIRTNVSGFPYVYFTPANGANGAAGGPAISLSFNITLNNTSGYIYGGGGGGGGGASNGTSGGGAGGGQSHAASAAGAGGGGNSAGSAGAAGGPSGGGAGGAPGWCYTGAGAAGAANGGAGGWGSTCGGGGGGGGIWGGVGGAGGGIQELDNYGSVIASASGGAGGAAGKAIVLNGKTVTWSGGNNATQVKGLVQ